VLKFTKGGFTYQSSTTSLIHVFDTFKAFVIKRILLKLSLTLVLLKYNSLISLFAFILPILNRVKSKSKNFKKRFTLQQVN
jgi:hypothetical protein